MKAKIKLLTYLFLGIINVNCQEKKETLPIVVENVNKMNDNNVETVLTKQLKQGSTYNIDEASAGLPKIQFEMNELEATAQLAENILASNGFKKLSNTEFDEKVKNIFGRILDNNSQKVFLYMNYFDRCSKGMVMYKNNGLDYDGTFIDKKRGLITDFYYVPELIDYEKEYPKLSNAENFKVVRKSSIDNLDIEVQHWKDNPDLKQVRKKNIQTIVARNLYIFNDSKVHYKWLILNDQKFMESLVTTFGYTQDLDLLKWVFEKTEFDKNNPQNYGKLFWTKQCDGTVKLHTNTFKMLQKLYLPNDSSENRFILDNIKDYIEYLGDSNTKENITESDKVKIMANLAYFAEQYKYDSRYKDGTKMMGRLRYFFNDGDLKILQNNNYFSMPKFKEWWDSADYDEYFVTECEYLGSCGKDNEPLNIVEWRKQHPKK